MPQICGCNIDVTPTWDTSVHFISIHMRPRLKNRIKYQCHQSTGFSLWLWTHALNYLPSDTLDMASDDYDNNLSVCTRDSYPKWYNTLYVYLSDSYTTFSVPNTTIYDSQVLACTSICLPIKSHPLPYQTSPHTNLPLACKYGLIMTSCDDVINFVYICLHPSIPKYHHLPPLPMQSF